ncbi:Hypothetical protein Minf_1686 [Methylacidiphilum infernorum V4]|uniref:Uncharacterized protein n=1 Tax=Methylacidiphilum infernorum (isolate V4) TaxID=481448 RepID=B3DWS7_METI4|nr:Hypothetical protein Minf_1686 [Methylacidiphilum infernorum V4]
MKRGSGHGQKTFLNIPYPLGLLRFECPPASIRTG